jgi:two-component system sensor histidine kinase BaeS
MTLNLLGKLFLALFVSMLVILALMMGSVQWSFRTGFADYLEQVRQQRLNKIALALAQAYGQHDDSWDFIYDDPEDWSALIGHRRHPHHKNPGHADWHSGHPPASSFRPIC